MTKLEIDQLPAGWVPRSLEEQGKFLRAHPVQNKTYVLPTPPLEAASDLTKERITGGAPCCGFVGEPRFGKTWAATYILAEIKAEFPDIHVVPLVCRQHNSKSPALLCDWWSVTTGGPNTRSRRDDPMVALVKRWGAEALAKSAQRIVFLIDELWRLTEDQLTTLADITNLLQREGIRSTCISFGSLETMSLKTTLLQTNRKDLIGRFLSRLHTFDGIASSGDLKSVLEGFDDAGVAEYPPKTGCSFTQFFLPAAFENGWRLSSCAAALWAEFKEAGPQKKGLEVGAEYIFSAAEYFLKKSMSPTAKKADIDVGRMKVAVSESGFADSLYIAG